MKLSNILTVVILMTVYSSVFAQEQPKTVKRVSIHDFYVQPVIFSERNTYGALSDFKTLAPQSVLLNNDLSGFSPGGGFSMSGSTMFSVMLGLQFSDQKKSVYKANPLLRLGICYFSGTSLTGASYKDEHIPYDTLTSVRTGQTVYIDSVIMQSYGMDYTSQQLRFDGSLIFRTDPEARFSLFAGIGITAGLSLNAVTYISYSSYCRTETRFPDGNTTSSYDYSGSSTDKTEEYRTQNNLGFSSYLPMGVDFRIGKKNEFWKLLHVFYELRPSINITSIPELRTITNASIQQGFGLRVSWN
jgi:hypothetical protein